MADVQVIVGPGVVADEVLLREVAEREFAAFGVSGSLVHAKDAAEVKTRCAGPGPLVVIPGPDDQVRRLMGESPGVVWVDLTRSDGVEVAGHLHGRGIGGLAWAIRHAVHRDRHPARRVAYGPHPDQWGELHVPPGPGPHPVVVLVHGGYWRAIWAADLMEALAVDLLERGFAVWNLEYRRPDLHGWTATTEDVAAGLNALPVGSLDLDRVAVVGHSAGAQLALRAAADGARVALAVSLAGVLDLVEGDRRWMSSGAVAAALGESHPLTGDPAKVYGEASPMLRLPLGVRQLIVQGSGDDLDLVDFGRRYTRTARECGDDVTYLEMSGDHFAVITPTTPIWRTTALAIADALHRPRR